MCVGGWGGETSRAVLTAHTHKHRHRVAAHGFPITLVAGTFVWDKEGQDSGD